MCGHVRRRTCRSVLQFLYLCLQVRQLQQVFQGLLQSTPERYNSDPTKLVRLWLHESDRTCECRRAGLSSGGWLAGMVLTVCSSAAWCAAARLLSCVLLACCPPTPL